jgi:hypothetical protein
MEAFKGGRMKWTNLVTREEWRRSDGRYATGDARLVVVPGMGRAGRNGGRMVLIMCLAGAARQGEH